MRKRSSPSEEMTNCKADGILETGAKGLGQLDRKGDTGEIRRGRWRQKPNSSYKTCCWNIPTHEPKTKDLSLAFASLMPLQDGFLPLLTEKVAS